MKNNRGQVLVLFIIFIPAIILILGLIIETGSNYLEKVKIGNTIKEALDYGLDNIDVSPPELDDKIRALITQNDEDIEITEIIINQDNIKITASKTVKFNFVYTNQNKIVISYTGKLEDNQKIIERN